MTDPKSWAAYFDKDREKACHAASAWHAKCYVLNEEIRDLRSQLSSMRNVISHHFGVDSASLDNLCNISTNSESQEKLVGIAVTSAVNAALGRGGEQPLSTKIEDPSTSSLVEEKRVYKYDEINDEDFKKKKGKSSKPTKKEFLKLIRYKQVGELYVNIDTGESSQTISSDYKKKWKYFKKHGKL